MSAQPTLGYWSLRGLAQPIRYLLQHTGTSYTDKQYDCGPPPSYDRAQWTSVKDDLGLDFPNLPYYLDGDLKITESDAIIRYIARETDMYGSSLEEKAKIDMAEGVMTDIARPLGMLFYNPNFETAKDAVIATVDGSMQKCAKILGSQDYISGSKISFADFMLYELLERFELLVPTCLSSYSSLQAFKKRVSELPAIKKYLASPAFAKIKDRFNGRMAAIGGGTY